MLVTLISYLLMHSLEKSDTLIIKKVVFLRDFFCLFMLKFSSNLGTRNSFWWSWNVDFIYFDPKYTFPLWALLCLNFLLLKRHADFLWNKDTKGLFNKSDYRSGPPSRLKGILFFKLSVIMRKLWEQYLRNACTVRVGWMCLWIWISWYLVEKQKHLRWLFLISRNLLLKVKNSLRKIH